MTGRSRGRGWTLLIAVLVTACEPDLPDAADAALRASLVSLWDGEERLCLGAVVAPGAVLTAQHCVTVAVAEGRVPELEVRTEGGRRVGVRSAEVLRPGADTLEALEGGDLALLVLSHEEGRALELATGALAAGASVYFVRAESGDVASAPVLHLDDSQLFVPGATCGGDSGGPLVASDGRLLGIASWRTPRPCGEGTSVFTAVLPHRAWVEEALARHR